MGRDYVDPLFVNGPLKGQSHRIARTELHRGVLVMPPLDPGTLQFEELPEPLRYYFRRYQLFGRVLWLGVLGLEEPDPADLFEVLLSVKAREAEDPV